MCYTLKPRKLIDSAAYARSSNHTSQAFSTSSCVPQPIDNLTGDAVVETERASRVSEMMEASEQVTAEDVHGARQCVS